MIDEHDLKSMQERFDERYVKKDACIHAQEDFSHQLSSIFSRFSVMEYQQKVNNWLTLTLVGGIIALVIKSFVGG